MAFSYVIPRISIDSLRPRLLAAADALAHLGLEVGRAERVPLLPDPVEQRPAFGGGESRGARVASPRRIARRCHSTAVVIRPRRRPAALRRANAPTCAH